MRHRKVCHLLDVTQLTNGRARLTSAVWLQSVLLNHHATYVRACSVASVISYSATPWTVTHQLPLSMGSPGKNTGVGCHALLQGIFLTQGSNLWLLRLLHCRQILYPPSHLGSSILPTASLKCSWLLSPFHEMISLCAPWIWTFWVCLWVSDHCKLMLKNEA